MADQTRNPDQPHVPNTLSLAFSEELYTAWLDDPASVPTNWQRYFESLKIDRSVPPDQVAAMGRREAELAERQNRVDQMIRNFRVRGHRIARLNPLADPPPEPPELTLDYYGFGEQDLDLPFSGGSLAPGEVLPLREILRRLQSTYCRYIGVQFMHIDDLAIREWLQQRMEPVENRCALEPDEQMRILRQLTDAVIFEEFIQKKYIGAKSFSLEGAETLIPLLDMAIEHAGGQGLDHVVLGMAHRGRLNVLANIMGKSPWQIFREFEDKDAELYLGHGDVKYHLGYHSDWVTARGHLVHLALGFNPSHLEYVNPVALGRVRARQDRDENGRDRSMALLIHGDAAFAGEGIIQESLNLSELEGYTTSGTLHVIVNNQIGFTTDPGEGRSSPYATDVARMLQIPIFHVNGEDPEAVAQVVRLALDFRREFRRDVVIDMYCYRRRGHNETDEPAFTQPLLYQEIRARESVREGYLKRLMKYGDVSREMADELADRRREVLEGYLSEARRDDNLVAERPRVLGKVWQDYKGGPEAVVPDAETRVPRERLQELLRKQAEVPDGFTPHSKIVRLLDLRQAIAAGERPVDWAAAEALAFASLVTEGHRVRLTGQDSERGTFSHRHAVLHDQRTGQRHTPLQRLTADQAPCEIYNSPLSEAGVMGFEYGYSLAYPDALVIWEAQFGDFNNAAQVIIDQFIAAGESKWRSLSGLTLFLPHGFEGMGPEHSSARIERFLSLTAEDNLQIAYPSTPAQLFHLLRRQVVRPWRKPLVVFTPKSMLRHPEVISSLDELADGGFQRIITDPCLGVREGQVCEALLCTGKVYYDLDAERRRLGREDLAILRLEQLYPLPARYIEQELHQMAPGVPVRWVQEEPENMGAWPYLRYRFGDRLLGRWPFSGVCRPESASVATGSSASHRLELEILLDRVFGPARRHHAAAGSSAAKPESQGDS
ncbi:MAG: 2-oxoglutarate dehydrogenase E1 component [Candidatus Krumholzibacteriia bacterium]